MLNNVYMLNYVIPKNLLLSKAFDYNKKGNQNLLVIILNK